MGGAARGAFFELNGCALREEVGRSPGTAKEFRAKAQRRKVCPGGEVRFQKELIREHDYTISHH